MFSRQWGTIEDFRTPRMMRSKEYLRKINLLVVCRMDQRIGR